MSAYTVSSANRALFKIYRNSVGARAINYAHFVFCSFCLKIRQYFLCGFLSVVPSRIRKGAAPFVSLPQSINCSLPAKIIAFIENGIQGVFTNFS